MDGVVAAHNGPADSAGSSECDGVWRGRAIALSPHCNGEYGTAHRLAEDPFKCRLRRPMTWRRTPFSADRGTTGPHSTYWGSLKLFYDDGLEGEGGDYWCPRMGSIYDGDDRR